MNIAECPPWIGTNSFRGACLDVLPGEGGRSGEILIALKNKHREEKLEAKLCHSEGSGLRHKHACKDLALEIVVDVQSETVCE